jgi:hypothetical protein
LANAAITTACLKNQKRKKYQPENYLLNKYIVLQKSAVSNMLNVCLLNYFAFLHEVTLWVVKFYLDNHIELSIISSTSKGGHIIYTYFAHEKFNKKKIYK